MLVETKQQKEDLVEQAEWRAGRIASGMRWYPIDRNTKRYIRKAASVALDNQEVVNFILASDLYRPIVEGDISASTAYVMLLNPGFAATPPLTDKRREPEFMAVLWQFCMHVVRSAKVATPKQLAALVEVAPVIPDVAPAVDVTAPEPETAPKAKRPAKNKKAAQAAHSAANRAKSKGLRRPGTRDVQSAYMYIATTDLAELAEMCIRSAQTKRPDDTSTDIAISIHNAVRAAVYRELMRQGFDTMQVFSMVDGMITRLLNQPKAEE